MSFRFLTLCTAWCLGIVFGTIGMDSGLLLVIMSILLVGMVWRHVHTPIIAVVGLLLSLGYVYGLQGEELVADQCVASQPLAGVVVAFPKIKQLQVQYLVEDERACRYLVLAQPWPLLEKGDTVRTAGKVEPVSALDTVYPEYAAYLRRQGISGTVSYAQVEGIQEIDSLSNSVRNSIREHIQATFSEPEASLASAMILAEEGHIPEDVSNVFKRSGVNHILAISGQNITLLAGIVLVILMALPISPWARAAVLLVIFWTYVLILGMPVSAVRAVMFASLILVAFRLRMLISLPTVLFCTVVALVTIKPVIILDVGFQLSFAAVVGMGLALFLSRGLPEPGTRYAPVDLISVSIGATAFTWPIVLYHFGTVSIIGIIANIIVVPIFSVLMVLMIVSLMTSFVSHVGARATTYLIHTLWDGTYSLTSWFAQVPGGYIEDAGISLQVVAVYYLVMLIVAHIMIRKQKRVWREVWQ